MRKLLLGLTAAAAIAAPIATATAAHADIAETAGSGAMDFVTTYQGATYVHHAAVQYTCDATGHVNFAFQGADDNFTGHGAGTITGSTFVLTGSRPDAYSYSISGLVDAAGVWSSVTSSDSFKQNLSDTGSFTGIPDCKVDAPVAKGNHGEYVSGATKAGVKGKDLAAIAKDVTLVGPYKG